VRLAGAALALCLASCSTNPPKPADVVSAVVKCATTVCASPETGPACAQLTSAAFACLASGANAGVCLGGVPSLIAVGYADVVCVVEALEYSAPTIEQRVKAADWLRGQRVRVER
jgi:hypothetical protein